jgi:hypothetical protein
MSYESMSDESLSDESLSDESTSGGPMNDDSKRSMSDDRRAR